MDKKIFILFLQLFISGVVLTSLNSCHKEYFVKLDPTITWAKPADIMQGTALSAAQLNASSDVKGTFTYSPSLETVLAAGANQVLTVRFVPDLDPCYNIATKTVLINVLSKKDPSITWANPSDINLGTALSSAQLNAVASVPGTYVYSPLSGTVLSEGTSQVLRVTFTPTDKVLYNVTTSSVTINVNKKKPTITWGNPVDIAYGTALSASQLNATSDVAGTFVYSPASGTKLGAGQGQVLKVTFTPKDATKNSSATSYVTINVTKKTPVITWANPAGITTATALSGTQLNATADVPGTFVYTPAAGTKLTAGTKTLSVTFTPTDAVNYASTTKTASIVVK